MTEYFGKRYGPYVLLEQLGQGGMARVFNALDSRTHQNVAVKVLLHGKRTSEKFLEQFEREAKALANLTHSNIVKVLDYGIYEEQPYLVMEYVPGGSLKDAMRHKVPWQSAAAFLAPIARALDYVHQQQIVHRDVKPSNILLQEDYRPMLADFGIVKLLESKDEKMEDAIEVGIGTPEYMAPEQAMGQDVTFRADIYSLGLVFYEMITGLKPFAADSPVAAAIKHVTDPLPLPTRVDRTIPRFVEHVILRAMQKNPEDRFTSMANFAEALELIAQAERTSGGKISKMSMQRRKKRQQTFSIYAFSVFLFFLIVGAIFAGYYYISGGKLSPVQPPTMIPSPLAAVPVILTPTRTVLPPTATWTPTRASATKPSATLLTESSPELHLLGTPLPAVPPGGFGEIARWGIGQVNTGRWSPDGGTIALGTTNGIYLYDVQTQELERFINTGFNVTKLVFRPVEDDLMAGSPTGLVRSWNWKSGKSIQNYTYTAPPNMPFGRSTPVSSLSYSLDGQFLVAGYENGSVNYFAANQGNPVWTFANPPTVSDAVISADGRFLFVSNESPTINTWIISDQKQQKATMSNAADIRIRRLKLSGDGQFLLAGGNGQSVYLWDPNSQSLLNSFANLGSKATDFDFSYDGKYVAIGLANGDIKVFETPALTNTLKSPVLHSSFNVYPQQSLSVSFSPNQYTLAAGNGQESLQVVDSQSGTKRFKLANEIGRITRMQFSNNGSWLATVHEGGLLRIWDVQQAKELHQIEGYLPKGNPFSPDNRYLAYVHPDEKNAIGTLEILNLQKWETVVNLSDYPQRAFVQFRDDSKLLVMGDPYGAQAWDVATWQGINLQPGAIEKCGEYFTSQGIPVTIISHVGILFTYDQKIQDMCTTNPTGAILKYYFQNDNRLLFVLGDGRIWTGNLQSPDLFRLPPSQPYPTSDAIFLAGDQSGWYAYVDGAILRIKNLRGNAGDTKIEEQDDYQYQVALLPGKHLMALGSRYGSIHIWSMP